MIEDENEQLGRSILLTSEIPGESLEESLDKLTPDQINTILLGTGKDIAKVHTISVNNYGRFRRRPGIKELEERKQSLSDYILWKSESGIDLLQQKGLLKEQDIDSIRELSNTYKMKFSGIDPTLSHGDFGMEHIYQKDGEYTGIIDWGDTCGTSIYHDLAHFNINSDEEHLEPLLEGYRSVKTLSDWYVEFLDLESLFVAFQKLRWIVLSGYYKPRKHEFLVDEINTLIEKLKNN